MVIGSDNNIPQSKYPLAGKGKRMGHKEVTVALVSTRGRLLRKQTDVGSSCDNDCRSSNCTRLRNVSSIICRAWAASLFDQGSPLSVSVTCEDGVDVAFSV